MSKKNALILEDTPANRLFFERFLMQAGFDVVSAESGREALEKISSLDELHLAVLDMEVPDINGLEMTVRIRRLFPDACLVVATMHDERSLMQSAFDKGCDIFLVKPHGFMDLYKRLTTEGTAVLHDNRPMLIDQYGPRKFQVAVTS